MSKATRGKKNSWRAKAMAALALAAAFGLPAGQGLAENLAVGEGETLNIDGRAENYDNVEINGGVVNIGGEFYNEGLSRYEPSALYGGFLNDTVTSFAVNGGTVNLSDHGAIAVKYDAVGDPEDFEWHELTIYGGAVNMKGSSADKAAIIMASAKPDTEAVNSSSTNTSSLYIWGGDINVAEGEFGAILSREVFMHGGVLNVNGTLTVAGASAFGTGAGLNLTAGMAAVTEKWGDFRLFGGTITLGAGGLLDLASNNIAFSTEASGGGGEFSGRLALVDSAQMPGTLARETLYAQNVRVGPATTLTVKSLDLSQAVDDAIILHEGADFFEVIKGGALVVNGETKLSADTGARALTMGNGSTLTARFQDFLTEDFTAQDFVQNALFIATGQGAMASTIYLTGGLETYTDENLADAKDALGASGSGYLKVIFLSGQQVDENGDAVVEDLTTDGGSDINGSAELPNNDAKAENLGSANATLSGDVTANTLTVSGDSSTGEIEDLTITGKLTLTGDGDSQLIKDGTSGNTPAIVIGGDNSGTDSGELNLGIAGNSGQGGTVNAAVKFGVDGGALTVNDGDFTIGSITAEAGAGNLDITVKSNLEGGSATLSTGNIDLSGASGVVNLSLSGGALEAGDIIGNGSAGTTLYVGDAATAGHVKADSVTAAAIVLDPDFTEESSTMTVAEATDIDLAILRNSWFLLDDAKDEAWVAAHIPTETGKLTAEAYTAALALRERMVMANDRHLVVDGGQTKDAFSGPSGDTTITFADKSLLLVDAAGLGDGAALTSGDTDGATAVVDAGATLKIVGAGANQTVVILDETFTTTGVDGWKWADGTLKFESEYLTGEGEVISGMNGTSLGYRVLVSANTEAVETLPDDYPLLSDSLAGMLQDFVRGGASNINSPNGGIQFVSNLLRSDLGLSAADAARTLEGAAQVAAAAGAPTLAANLGGQTSGLVVAHNSLLNDAPPSFGDQPGQFGLWLTPFYGMSDVDGLDAGQFENAYEMNYGGAVLGLDYNISERFRLGLALNAGGGDSESQGDFNKTENDFDFWGLSLYGSYSNGAFGLTGDLGITAVSNEIRQNLPAALGLGNRLRAATDSDLFTVGLTGEYRVTTGGGLEVTPHAGLRYTKISTDQANVKLSDGRRVFDVDTDDQNLFQIPLGVKLSKGMVTEGGWTVTPSADLGVLFTMGDTDVDSRARISGTGYSGVTNSETADKAAFTGALGIQAKSAGGLTLGLEYGLLASGNQTDHSISGLLRFDF